MNSTAITRRIVTMLTGPAVAAGLIAGSLALGAAPAHAGPPQVAQNCTTTGSPRVTPNSVNPLTRPAQVGAAQPAATVYAPPTTCIKN